MKTKIALAGLLGSLVLISSNAVADEYTAPPKDLVSMKTTAYCMGTTTADGSKVRYGICAVKRDWIGYVALVYEDMDGKPGELLGIFECKDTGGAEGIKNGYVIDIYEPTLDECYEWMKLTGGKVIVQFVEAHG